LHIDSDTLPTRPAKPAAKLTDSRETPSLRIPTPMSDAMTPAGALRRHSLSRARVVAGAAIAVCSFGMLMPWIVGGGTPISRIVLSTNCGVIIAVFLSALWLTRSGRQPTSLLLAVMGETLALGSIGVYVFWGIYSPAVAIFVFGLYAFATAVPIRVAVAVYLTLALVHAGMGALSTWEVIPDIGVINGTGLPVRDQVMSWATPQLFLLVAFVSARLSRRSTLASMADLDTAVRSVAVREALLNEARLDLKQARSGPGLFSGQVIGSYRLGDVIGRGGMGEVYEASHVDTDEQAAVKLLHRYMLGDTDKVERFLREVRIAAALDAPNIVRVLEYSDIDAPIPYLAMECLVGEDLSTLLRSRGRLSLEGVVDLVDQVASGLDVAHDAGVVHRDLKPANLYLSKNSWKILDFGVSKLTDGSGTLTRGGMLGTPGYMAPEQIEGQDVDRRADVFALAAIAYRCLTSRPAFVGDEAAVMHQTLKKMPPRPSSLAQVDAQVDDVLAIGLAKDPDGRFANAGEFNTAFADAAKNRLSSKLRERAVDLESRWSWS
jgi:serine/threonine-protein kinase